MMKNIFIMKKYLNLIQEGLKTYEGRIAKEKYLNLEVGEKVKFIENENLDNFVICEITSCEKFSDFRSMLLKIGLKRMLPDVTKLDDGIDIYNNIPGYAKDIIKYGVLAIGVKVAKI
jgi:ASC-1-like (ASCH) protein